MKREIFEVYAKVIDANGAYNTLSGYPKSYDSRSYNNNIDTARKRAYGEYHEALGAMCKRDDRQQQIVMILRASDGMQIEKTSLGTVADLPDPTYALTVESGAGSGEYLEGAVVRITADTPEEGKIFDAWEYPQGLVFAEGGVNTYTARIIMPASATTITATYKDIPEPEPEDE